MDKFAVFQGELSPKNKWGLYDTASPEKFFGVSLAYVQSLEGSQKPVEVSCDVT